MILRKPFAILIKYFKLIHLVLAGFAIYLTIETNTILSFFSTYLQDVTNIAGTNLVETLYHPLMFWSIFIMIIGSIVIAVVMAVKKKPILFYGINILIYLYVVVIFFVTQSIVSALEIGLVDVRTLKLMQDFLTTSFLLQFANLILLSIRATGFDIKKFNFVKDLEELEITDVDNEEFEVSMDLDADKIHRNIRKFFRHLRYVYKENKLVVHLVAALVIGIGCYFTYSKVIVEKRTFREQTIFSVDPFMMGVNSTKLTTTDYRGKSIASDTTYVVVSMNLKSYSTSGIPFETSHLYLRLKDHNFSPTEQYSEALFDLGPIYKGEKIATKFESYSFVFAIPTGFVKEKMVLHYEDGYGNHYKVKLKPKSFSDESTLHESSEPEVIDFKTSLIGDLELTIEGTNIQPFFQSPYTFCYNSACKESYEILRPSFTDNYEKGLFYVQGVFQKKDFKLKNINTLFDLTSSFGTILYRVNGIEKSFVPTKQVKPNKYDLTDSVMVLEVPKELQQADSIVLRYQIRNDIYEYVVK